MNDVWRITAGMLGLIWALGASEVRGEQGPPVITQEPADQSVSGGTTVALSVAASGALPFSYQWQRGTMNLPRQTNATLEFNPVIMRDYGDYRVLISNASGSVTSRFARVAVDEALTFRIERLLTNGVRLVNHATLTGDDRGGVAVSSTQVFVTGDQQTARFAREYLDQGAAVGVRHEAMVSDLRSATVYVLGNGDTPLASPSTVTSLLELDGATGSLSGRRIDLSQPINLVTTTGIFAGYGRIALHTGISVYTIDVPSGLVTFLGNMISPVHWFSETWAYWGIAEYIGGTVSLVYVQDPQHIQRLVVPGGPLTTLANFVNLGDMASISFSADLSRWYFHEQGFSQFGNGTEMLGSAKADFITEVLSPVIIAAPTNTVAFAEEGVSWHVTAIGEAPLRYQWRHAGTNLTGATNADLTLLNLQSVDAGPYTVVVSNAFDFVESNPFLLTVVTVPLITRQPQHVLVFPGTNVSFLVAAIGPGQLTYQWRHGNALLPDQTNAVLNLTNVHLPDAGLYSVIVSNHFGATLSSNAILTVFEIIDDGSVFRIERLGSNGCAVVDHDNITGDDRGGIAVSQTHVLITGDNATGRFALDDLSGGTRLPGTVLDGMVANLRTETVYLLGNGSTPLPFLGGTLTTLLELNNTGQLTGNRIELSRAIEVSGNGGFLVGLFSGYGQIMINASNHVYNIALPSGEVADFGEIPFYNFFPSESWAYWGVAEHYHGYNYLVYVRPPNMIVRTRVPDGLTENVAVFSNLGDMASFTLSPSRQRWYFHYELTAQFGGQSETLGYCDAQLTIDSGSNPDRFEWDPISRVQVVDVPFTARLRAINTAGQVVTNFNGTARLSARNLSGGQNIQLDPTTLSNFVDGVWIGQVTIHNPSASVVLDASDRSGSIGTSLPFSVSPLNDLALLIEDQPDPVVVGEPLRYTILVTNTGPMQATSVIVTNTLSTNLLFQSVSSTRGSCQPSGRTIRCDLGTLGAEGAIITVETLAASAGSLTNVTQVFRGEADALSGNNQVTTVTRATLNPMRISDAMVVEGTGGSTQMVFEVSFSPASTNTVRVSYTTVNGTALGSGSGRDFTPRGGTLTFPPGTTNMPVQITITSDAVYELDEQFLVQLFSPSGAFIEDNEGRGLILNDDNPPTLTVTDATVVENDTTFTNLTFNLVLSETSGAATVIRYATSNDTATAGTDFVAASGEITFQANTRVLTQSVSVSVIGDRIPEGEERLIFQLLSVSNAVPTRVQAIGTIIDNEGPGILDHFQFEPIASPQILDQPFNVTVTARDILGGQIPDFNDVVALRGLEGDPPISTNILAGLPHESLQPEGSFTIGYAFTPTNDMFVTGIRHYSGTKVSIWTDDGVLIASQAVQSTPATWLETALSQPVTLQANVTYRVGYFGGGQPYYWTTLGPLTFASGNIGSSVFQSGDTFPDQVTSPAPFIFLVDLAYQTGPPLHQIPITPTMSSPFVNGAWSGTVTFQQFSTNAYLEAALSSGLKGRSLPIRVVGASDTDLALSVVVSPQPVVVGGPVTYALTIDNLGPALAENVVLSNSLPAGLALLSVVSSQGSCDTNTAGLVLCVLGNLAAGTNATVTISVLTKGEGIITNRAIVLQKGADVFPDNNQVQVETPLLQPALTIADASVQEGNTGTNFANFVITLWPPTLGTVRVSYTTVNGTATGSGNSRDFLPRSAQITFSPGTTNQTVSIPIIGDTRYEPDETFPVQLFGATGARIDDLEAIGTILNDDPRPALSVRDVTLTEGQTGTSDARFEVVLSLPSGQPVIVGFRTVDDSAQAAADYGSRFGALTFPGASSVLTQIVQVPIFGDVATEPNEQFFLELYDATGADLAKRRGTATILNDDLAGTANHYSFAPISSPQRANEPISVRIAALDGLGNVDSNHNDSITFTATSFYVNNASTLFGSLSGTTNLEAGASYGFSFLAKSNLLVTQFKHIAGTHISLWTGDGQLLAEKAVNGPAGIWTTTPLDTPVALLQDASYRVAVLSPSSSVPARLDLNSELTDVRILQAYQSVEDTFPVEPNNTRWPLVDFVYGVGTPVPLMVTPTSPPFFTNGIWQGSLIVNTVARSVVLGAQSFAGLRGFSSAIDLFSANDLQLTSFSAADPTVVLGQSTTFKVAIINPGPDLSTQVVVTNTLAAGLIPSDFQPTLGTVTNSGPEVVWTIGNLSPGASAELTMRVTASVVGMSLASRATVSRLEADPVLANNSATVFLNVLTPLVNGSFETGNFAGWITTDLSPAFQPWSVQRAGFQIGFDFFTATPTDGNFAACNGLAGAVGTLSLAQDVFVPTQLPLLAFDYRLAWQYFTFGQAKELSFTVRPRGGGPALFTTNLLVLEGTINRDTGPLTTMIDLTRFAGGNVRISFECEIFLNFDGPGFLQLDNVRFERPPEAKPSISEQPQDASANTGEDVAFSVAATGTLPFQYQWRRGAVPITDATNAILTLPDVNLHSAGLFDVIVSNQFGAVTSATARLLIDQGTVFQILSLETNRPIVVDVDNLIGDDRGGIAVSDSHVFLQGDGTVSGAATAQFNIEDLSGGRSLGRGYDAMISDLKSGRLYSLGNGANFIQNTNGLNFTTADSLIELDGATGLPTGTRINLSAPIPLLPNNGTGLFAGYGRLVITASTNAYNISLPSGIVTVIPSGFVFGYPSENFAFWGIAEYFNDAVQLVFVESQQAIVRLRLPDGIRTPVLQTQDFLGDMASITFSPAQSRWFFHFESGSIFRPNGGETIGSAKGSYTTDPGYPSLLVAPGNQVGFAEDSVTFQVVATGVAPLHYQWFFNGQAILGQTQRTLVLTNLSQQNAGGYSVEVSNPIGFVVSPIAQLTVLAEPDILLQPANRAVLPGTNVSFSVLAQGATPLFYQWQHDGVPILHATNSILSLSDVAVADKGSYTVVVSNRFGSVLSQPALLTVIVIVDDGSVFRITNLGSNGCPVVDHNNLTGDDRGGIAASSTHIFITGDERTGRFSLDNLSGGTAVGNPRFDALVSDLRTETLYTLADGNTPLTGPGTVTSLLELSSTGQLNGRRINLSAPVLAQQQQFGQVGIFVSYGRLVIHNGQSVYSIALPSGRVSFLGNLNPLNARGSENWAFYGVAELVGGYTFLTYARFDNTIARTRVPDGQTTVLAAFQNLSDMAAFTVSLSRNRWYFHYEGSGQFGGTSETLGYCEASFEVSTGFNADRFQWSPLPRLVQVGQPFPATLTARNSANQVATNFSGTVTVQAVPTTGGAAFPVTVLSNFVDGVWSGFLTVTQAGVDLQLRAEDVDLHSGLSQLITVAPANDLALLAETRPSPVPASEMFSYLLTVTNLGPAQATGVTLTNVLPPDVVFVRTTNTQGSCQQNGGVVRCDLGSLAGSSSATVEIFVAAPGDTVTLTNRTSIGRAETDALPQDNTVVLLTPVMLPILSISDATQPEGDAGTADMVFQVSLSSPRTNTVRVSYTTVNGTAIGSGSRADFSPRSAALTFQPGVTNLTIAVPIRGDVSYEGDETFVVQLFGSSGAQLADIEGVGTILNDDESPTLTIQDVSVVEGNIGVTQAVFQITLSKVSGLAVPVVYATSNGTAQAGLDYRPMASNFIFQANSTTLTQTVVVPVLGDNAVEPDEVFYLNLLSVSNAIVLRSQAVGTIVGDDGAGFLDHFQWDSLASPQPILRDIPVTITARDVFGDLVDFDGTVALRGLISRGSASSIVITEVQPGTPDAVEFVNVQESPVDIGGWVAYIYDDVTWPAPAVTFNFPAGTIVSPGAVFRITEFGTAPGVYPEFLAGVNISWTHSTGVHVAVLLANAGGELVDLMVAAGAQPSEITNPFTPSAAQWAGAVVPADEDDATTYQRIGNLDHHNNSDWTIGMPSLGSVNTDLIIPFTGGTTPVAIFPTNTANFAQGTWHAAITIREPATNMILEASDSAGHRGSSNPFDAISIPTADVALMVQAQSNPVPLNGQLVYSVLVTNRGPGVALNVILTNILASHLTLLSANTSQGELTTNNNVLRLAVQDLAPNAVATLIVTGQPNALGLMTNRIDVTTTSQDPLLLNNHAEVVQMVWVDSDGDGMSDNYENANQFNPLDPADAGMDADQDGQTNLEESRAGTNPHDPSSVMRITSIEVVGNDVCIRFTGVSGKLYRLERRKTDSGPWETVLVFRIGRSLEIKVVDAGGANFPMAVYRVQLAQ